LGALIVYPLKTAAAVRELRTSYFKLYGLLRYNKIPPPAKDSSGDYLWTLRDLERARKALGAGREEVAAP
jgi:hypothetical protein